MLIYTTPTQPHRNTNTHRTKNNTTNVVIQQNSCKLLMIDILMSETCWAHEKWNRIATDIKLVFHSSTITMMHGPINIRKNNFNFCYNKQIVYLIMFLWKRNWDTSDDFCSKNYSVVEVKRIKGLLIVHCCSKDWTFKISVSFLIYKLLLFSEIHTDFSVSNT